MTIKYISYGGGVNSTALMILMEGHYDEIIFVWHGGDYPVTYDYVEYIQNKGFDITILKPDVEGFDNLYDYCFEKKIIPSRMFRWCTDKFKLKPIYKYIVKPCEMMIGICEDEKGRTNVKSRKDINISYPLINNKIDRNGCIKIIEDAGLKVPPRSGCYFCPFMKSIEIRKLFIEYPDLYNKAKKLEENCMRSDIYIKNKPFREIAMEHILPLQTYL